MSRAEFMERLRALLSEIEESEREEALNYYEDYFNDAGEENEQEVIKALGSPEKVAKTIMDGLNDSHGAQGEFSETGFSGYEAEEKNEVGYHEEPKKQRFSDTLKNLGTGGIVLILVLAIFALPVLGPIVIGIISAIGGILLAAAGVLFALVIVGAALLIAGIAVFAAAAASLFVTPPVGILLFGIALLLLGIGILLEILGIWIVWKLLPSIIRWIVRTIRRLLGKKEG